MDPGCGGHDPGRGVHLDHDLMAVCCKDTGFQEIGHGPDGGVAAEIGVAFGIHVDQAEGAVRGDRLRQDGRQQVGIAPGLLIQ